MKFYRNFLFFILALCLANQANAAVSLKVKSKDLGKSKILFFGFNSPNPKLDSDIAVIFDKVKANLKTTDLFEIIKQEGVLEESSLSVFGITQNEAINPQEASVEAVPNFEKYSKSGVSAIVIGAFVYNDQGELEVRIRMWDVLDQRQLFGKFYTASQDNFRKLSALISNEIFKGITGEKIGHFDSKIIYISESGSFSRRIKKISSIDLDGSSRRLLTDGRDLVLTPIFSRKKNEIYYLRYFEGKPQIFSLDSINLRSKKLGGFRGTTFSAGTNPKDENLILLSAIIDGNSDIYEFNIEENIAKRLTKSPAIDTTPCYSPDGKKIVFASDRDSGQQIYVMDSNGSSVKRISSGNGSYAKPVWSPDGSLIAFTKSKSGQFFIGVMAPNGKGEKLLTGSYMAEGARWSPSGRYLIYSKKKSPFGRDSIPRLYVIDIITGYEFEVPTPENEGASDPDWA
jgi:TolB protein